MRLWAGDGFCYRVSIASKSLAVASMIGEDDHLPAVAFPFPELATVLLACDWHGSGSAAATAGPVGVWLLRDYGKTWIFGLAKRTLEGAASSVQHWGNATLPIRQGMHSSTLLEHE